MLAPWNALMLRDTTMTKHCQTKTAVSFPKMSILAGDQQLHPDYLVSFISIISHFPNRKVLHCHFTVVESWAWRLKSWPLCITDSRAGLCESVMQAQSYSGRQFVWACPAGTSKPPAHVSMGNTNSGLGPCPLIAEFPRIRPDILFYPTGVLIPSAASGFDNFMPVWWIHKGLVHCNSVK